MQPVYALSDSSVIAKEFGFGKGFRNLLMGRVCANWKESALTFFCVTLVISAIYLFINGKLILSLFLLLNAAFNAILRREIHDITNLHKQNVEYSRNNDQHLALNYQQKESVIRLEKTVTTLNVTVEQLATEAEKYKGENIKFKESNEEYQRLNIAARHLLEDIARQSTGITEMFTNALQNGQEINAEMLRQYRETAGHISEQMKLFDRVKNQVDGKAAEMERATQELISIAKQSNTQHLETLNAVQQLASQAKQELAAAKAELDVVRKQVQEQTRILEETVRRVDEATKHNEAAARISYNTALGAQQIGAQWFGQRIPTDYPPPYGLPYMTHMSPMHQKQAPWVVMQQPMLESNG